MAGSIPFLLSNRRPALPLKPLGSSAAGAASPEVVAAFALARSLTSACSSMRICLLSWSLSFLALRTSPSCFAIFAFISARSMSHALRARSWLCHSSWRKRMTPINYCERILCRQTRRQEMEAGGHKADLGECIQCRQVHWRLVRQGHSWLRTIATP